MTTALESMGAALAATAALALAGSAALVPVDPAPPRGDPPAEIAGGGGTGRFALGGGDTCAAATVISSLPFSDTGTTCGFDDDYDEICPFDTPGSPDVVYVYTPPVDMIVDISLCGDSDYDTKMYLYRGICSSYQSGIHFGCNDDNCSTPSYPPPHVSEMSGFPMVAGYAYYLVIDGYGGDCGTYTLDITPGPPIPECPPGTMFAQNPNLTFGAGLSDTVTGSGCCPRYENFSGLSQPICAVEWYGYMTIAVGDFAPCVEDPAFFTVEFYEDAGGLPGMLVAGRAEWLSAEPTGMIRWRPSGGYEVLKWTMEISCLDLPAGWITISSSLGDPDCRFFWLNDYGTDDDGSLFYNGSSFVFHDEDLSFCLVGAVCGDDEAGNCYVSNGSPFCEDLECCETICDVDPFCCDTVWDVQCAITAGELCGNCGGSDAGSCFADNGSPGCDDAGCCQIVCIADPYCCNVEWDGICADDAATACSGVCCLPSGGCLDDEPAGDCLAAGGTFQGVDENCSSVVCPFPQCPGAGECYVDNGSPGCGTTACCNVVCNFDSFCCTSFWDDICAEEALELCGNCGGADAGSCFVSNGSPGCSDYDCCATVCVLDDYCCDVMWDGLCADDAADLCEQSCPCDHDGDGDIDVDDLLAVLGSWGGPAGDCTGDGTTDVDDLLSALGLWGPCP